jgi:hypothetical protein
MVTAGGGMVYIIVINGGATIEADMSALGVDDCEVSICEYSSTSKDVIRGHSYEVRRQFTFSAPASGIALAGVTPSPTLIELASFTATPHRDHVRVERETASEVDNYGFNIFRSAVRGEHSKLNDTLIPAQGGPTWGASYTYDDADTIAGITHYYKLEDVDVHGRSTFHGPVQARLSPWRTPLPARPRPVPLPGPGPRR